MKQGALCLLLCILLASAAPAGAGRAVPTALYLDHFEDTALLEEVENLVAADSFLQVPGEVRWVQDSFADFYPGAGVGVDLYAQPGSVVLARFTPDRRVNDSAAGLQTDAAAAYGRCPAGSIQDIPCLYAAWADGRGGDLDIYFSRSTDGGATWTASRRLNTAHTAGDQRLPALVASGSRVYAAWEGAAGVYFSRSPDGGNTWSEDALLAAGGSEPRIAASPVIAHDILYLAYLAEESPGDVDVYARRSADSGNSWSPPEDVVEPEPAGARQGAPAIAMADGADDVWIAWVDDREGQAHIYAGRRVGPLWSNMRVDAAPPGAVPSQPALFYPGRALPARCAWADGRGGQSALYWARYDSECGWVEMGAIPHTAGAHSPAAAPAPSGAWAGWSAAPPGTEDIPWAGRYDAGEWGTPAAVSDHLPGVSHSAVTLAQADLSGATIAVLWSDDRGDEGDIYTAASDGGYRSTGIYTSTVHRFGDLAAWGRIAWTGSELTCLAVEVRGGDTPIPDTNWSPWTAADKGSPVPLAPAAYLQYRARLQRTTDGNTPTLESLEVAALPRAGTAVSVPAGRCVASWGEFASEGDAPPGTTLTLSLLDLDGRTIVSDVVTPYDLSALSPALYPRLRLRVDMQRSPDATPLLNWWQVSWQEGTIQAGFAFEPPAIYTPTVVQFTDQSTATVLPLAYAWHLGDGVTTTLQHPTHTYALPGLYTVTLRAAGECGEDALTRTLNVRPLPTVPPVAALSHGPLCAGSEVSFTNRSSDAVWWHWDLGDGQGSTRFHPTHLYGAAGDYTVTLAVTNTVGSDRATELLAVRPAPTASFTWAAELLTVTLTPTVSGDPDLRWDFGDGTTSTLAHPVHTYAASGAYTVTLDAANACSAATAVGRVEVFCAPAAVLGLSWQPAAPTPGETITFTAVASGSPPLALNWAWSDGGAAQGAIVTRALALPGSYAVTLTAGNPCGQATVAGRVQVARPVFRAFLPLAAREFYAGDAFEPDNSPGQARLLKLDSPQQHDFGMPGDIDWVYLELEAGVTYNLRTMDLGGEADTWIYLYAPGSYGAPLLDNDDCNGWTRASCLTFVPAAAGRYELLVTNIVGLWGPGVRYTLEMRME